MRLSHYRIETTVHTMEEGFSGFSSSLGASLTDHAKLTAKAIGGVIGHYQGKAQKAAEGEIEGLTETLSALGPLAELIGGNNAPPGGNSGKGKFHM